MNLKIRKPAALGKGQAGCDMDVSANHIRRTHQASKKTPLRRHINLMCKTCIYDPCQHGTWRQQVESCTSYNCPLFTVRPVPKGANMASKTIESAEINGRAP